MTHVQSASTGYKMDERPVPPERPTKARFISAREYIRGLPLATYFPFASLNLDQVTRNVSEIVQLRKGHRFR
jgi:hypothetical protein